jgi:DNA repair exonuclease SbcCD ATPase subunit
MYKRDVYAQLIKRNDVVHQHESFLVHYHRMLEENKQLHHDLTTKDDSSTPKRKFNPYLKQPDEVEDIDTFVHEEHDDDSDDEKHDSTRNKNQRSLPDGKKEKELTRDERREMMESMVQIMRDKAQMMDSMLQLTNYLQDAEKKLEEKSELCETLQQSNKTLQLDVEKYKAEGDYFLVEIRRRDEEIEEADDTITNIRQKLDEVTEKFKQLNSMNKDLQELSETQSRFLQEQYKNHQEQLQNIFDQFEKEKNRRIKLEVFLEEKFHIKPTVIPNSPQDEEQPKQIVTEEVKTSYNARSPTSPTSFIHQIKFVKRIVRMICID